MRELLFTSDCCFYFLNTQEWHSTLLERGETEREGKNEKKRKEKQRWEIDEAGSSKLPTVTSQPPRQAASRKLAHSPLVGLSAVMQHQQQEQLPVYIYTTLLCTCTCTYLGDERIRTLEYIHSSSISKRLVKVKWKEERNDRVRLGRFCSILSRINFVRF